MEVTPYYDPMLGKLICWGRTRDEACDRMSRALSEFFIGGVQTTIHFCQAVINHEAFRKGVYDTHFYQDHGENLVRNLNSQSECELIAATAAMLSPDESHNKLKQEAVQRSPWVLRRRQED